MRVIMNDVNPPLDEILEHHGIKGMKWGVRRQRSGESSGSSSSRKKTAVKVGVGVLAVGGAAAATYVLAKNGHLPAAQAFGMSFKAGRAVTPTARSTQSVGHQAVKTMNNTVWKSKVSSLSKEIADANASQDQWMRSIGLGKVVNNRMNL